MQHSMSCLDLMFYSKVGKSKLRLIQFGHAQVGFHVERLNEDISNKKLKTIFPGNLVSACCMHFRGSVRYVHITHIEQRYVFSNRHSDKISVLLFNLRSFLKARLVLVVRFDHKLGPSFINRKVKTSEVLFFWGVSYQTIVMIRQEGFMLTFQPKNLAKSNNGN